MWIAPRQREVSKRAIATKTSLELVQVCWRVPELRVNEPICPGTQLDTREYALTAGRWGGVHERHERDCAR
jgi:hypothetical protein